MRKRILALAAVVGLAVGAGAFAMQPAVADGCDDTGDQYQDGDEAAGVYVDAPVTEDVLGRGLLPVVGTPTSAYAEVQEDGDHAPVNVEAGVGGDGHMLTYTCSDAVIDFVEDQLP